MLPGRCFLVGDESADLDYNNINTGCGDVDTPPIRPTLFLYLSPRL